MYYRLFSFVSLLLVSAYGVAQAATTEYLDMFVGEVRVFNAINVERIALGRGKLLKVEPKESGELILIAQDVGSTSLRVWSKDGQQRNFNIRISENDPKRRLKLEDIVRIKVRMIEVRKSSTDKLGIDWSESINGPAYSTVADFASNGIFRSPGDSGITEILPLNTAPFATHFGIATSIQSKINILASSGDATTLAEPTLSCVNGGQASFLAGGEIPYPVTGSNGQTSVEFKDYGIKLDVSPVADDSGKIYTKIATEISQIDASVTVLGAPGILTRRAATEMNVLSGQTIVIAGLLSAESSNDQEGIPFLKDIPIIGNLFKSDSYINKKSELIVFVTPELINTRDAVFSDNDKRLYEQGDRHIERVNTELGIME